MRLRSASWIQGINGGWEMDDWEPLTKLGRMVKNGEIRDIKEVFKSGLPVMETEIVDTLLPDMEEEVLDINIVQRMHKSGRRVRFRATVVIGNKDGYVGLGNAVAKEVGPAIRKAIRVAKLNLIEIRRGCGSWECGCGATHSVPFTVTGKSGSVRVTLIPAPKGLGLATGDVSKKVLILAGVTDVWSRTSGQTKSTVNTAKATFDALRQTSLIKITSDQAKKLGIIEGMVER
jgi:small subunit ribosomal protein S5